MDNLTQCTFDNTPTFSLEGLSGLCKVLKVYDGDTLWIAFAYKNLGIYKIKCRMYGYDSPEMRSTSENEKRAARDAKKFLEEITDPTDQTTSLSFEFQGYDKYGRVLIRMFRELADNKRECINDIMIQKGYGQVYFGGKKPVYLDDIEM